MTPYVRIALRHAHVTERGREAGSSRSDGERSLDVGWITGRDASPISRVTSELAVEGRAGDAATQCAGRADVVGPRRGRRWEGAVRP
jgi:hypothetical protein